jgi:hypothetical protein
MSVSISQLEASLAGANMTNRWQTDEESVNQPETADPFQERCRILYVPTAMLQATSVSETRQSAREVKFIVAPDVAARILEWSRSRLSPDPYAGGAAGDEYRTTTLYFDTPDFDVYHRRGSYGRSKYRVRRYGTASVVFLERKLRTATLLSKRRTTIPLADLPLVSSPNVAQDWPAYWFAQRLAARQVSPICQVAYHRHARVGTGPYGPVRLTFDDGIVVQPCTGLEFAAAAGYPVLADRTIVEMKFRVDMPAVLKHLVEAFKLEPSSVSKYRASIEGLSREGLRAGSQHADLRLALGSGVMTSSAGEPGA